MSKSAIREFAEQNKGAAAPLLHWFRVTQHAKWRHLADTRADFPHADPVGIFTVFNVGGNNLRVVTTINYRWQMVYIRHILTHTEYEKKQWMKP